MTRTKNEIAIIKMQMNKYMHLTVAILVKFYLCMLKWLLMQWQSSNSVATAAGVSAVDRQGVKFGRKFIGSLSSCKTWRLFCFASFGFHGRWSVPEMFMNCLYTARHIHVCSCTTQRQVDCFMGNFLALTCTFFVSHFLFGQDFSVFSCVIILQLFQLFVC